MQSEILHSELLKDFVSAGVALEIDSTVRASDHLWMDILLFGGILLGTMSHLDQIHAQLCSIKNIHSMKNGQGYHRVGAFRL